MNGSLIIGNILLIYAAVTMLIKALTDFAMTFTDLRNNNEHLIRYFEYISMEEQAPMKSQDTNNKGNVTIINVSFKYPGTKTCALKT